MRHLCVLGQSIQHRLIADTLCDSQLHPLEDTGDLLTAARRVDRRPGLGFDFHATDLIANRPLLLSLRHRLLAVVVLLGPATDEPKQQVLLGVGVGTAQRLHVQLGLATLVHAQVERAQGRDELTAAVTQRAHRNPLAVHPRQAHLRQAQAIGVERATQGLSDA
jgi:hypothetical protein